MGGGGRGGAGSLRSSGCGAWFSAVAVVSAAWYLGVETARELGAVLALGFTGAFLFWLATRMGREEPESHGSGPLGPD